jgi:DegV family protein with EDD domain
LQVHIVTDSSAHFAHPQVAAQYPITVVPNTLMIAGKAYREGVDITAERAIELLAHQPKPPQVVAPTVDAFATAYTRLAHHQDAVISIHTSRELTDSYINGQRAARQLEGHVKVYVIDSCTLDAAQGMIVRFAARAVKDGVADTATLDAIVRDVRSTVERAFAVYYVESMDYLMQNGLLSRAHAVLSAMNQTMPLLSVEDGMLVTMEKVRSRSQATDRLIEFATEFEAIEDVLILQPGTFLSEHTRNLQDRLSQEFPDKHFPHAVYSASLAAIIGADATGLALLEGEEDVS